jgi:hypothetical protein
VIFEQSGHSHITNIIYKMKQIDFTGKFLGLDGLPIMISTDKELADINIFVGNALASLKTTDPLRNLMIAKDIFTKRLIYLNEADCIFLLDRIKELNLSDVLYEQLRSRIDNSKEAEPGLKIIK